MLHRGGAEGRQIDMDEEKCRKGEGDDHMDDVHERQAAEHPDHRTEQLHVQEEYPCNDLDRHEEEHDKEIRNLLERIKFLVRRGVMWISIASEEAVSIIFRLGQATGQKLFQIKRRDIEPHLPGKDIIAEPQNEAEYRDDTKDVMNSDSSPELRQARELMISELYAGENKDQKRDRICPMPYPDKQRVEVYLFRLPCVDLLRPSQADSRKPESDMADREKHSAEDQ